MKESNIIGIARPQSDFSLVLPVLSAAWSGISKILPIVAVGGIICVLTGLFYPDSASAQIKQRLEASIMVHFKTGQAVLGKVDRARLKQFFEKYETGPHSRVFVVGYTDAVGAKNPNYQLSRNRAKALRRDFIKYFGLKASVIMALGKGEENPVGDNGTAKGRASNRRAEIYLVNTRERSPQPMYGTQDPNFSNIQSLVEQARDLIKQRRIGPCMRILQKARALGGDHYADWHAAYGVAGFYAHAPAAEINLHLAMALQLDPHNEMARTYLGRFTARQNVMRGKVTSRMGRSIDNPIKVTSKTQPHEYLRLFEVEPQAHRLMEGRPVDRWDCLDRQGAPVTYFFDHSSIYDWAFAKRTASEIEKRKVPNAPGLSPVPDKTSRPTNGPPAVTKPKPGGTQSVWESKVFR